MVTQTQSIIFAYIWVLLVFLFHFLFHGIEVGIMEYIPKTQISPESLYFSILEIRQILPCFLFVTSDVNKYDESFDFFLNMIIML